MLLEILRIFQDTCLLLGPQIQASNKSEGYHEHAYCAAQADLCRRLPPGDGNVCFFFWGSWWVVLVLAKAMGLLDQANDAERRSGLRCLSHPGKHVSAREPKEQTDEQELLGLCL